MTKHDEHTRAGLIDVSDIPLKELLVSDDTVLAHALRRIVDAADREYKDPVSAFNSVV